MLERHPLTTLLARHSWKATAYLKRVADQHRAMGFGQMGTRREKLCRWTRGDNAPEIETQLAMAAVHGVPATEVRRRGWPDWLLLALTDDRTVWESPWTPTGTLQALDAGGLVGGPVDRRGFTIASLAILNSTGAHWAATRTTSPASPRGRRIGARTADLFDTRLDTLRHLDDTIGSTQAHHAAVAELALITNVLKTHSYSDATGRRLYAAAAEACRLAGWCAYDSGRLAAAEESFAAALRCSATSGDVTIGAIALAFWANLRYSAGDPYGALGLVERALDSRRKTTSPRVLAMLHARAARAHSKAGESTPAYQAIDAAFAAYDHAGPAEQDLPSMYWMTQGEVHEVAASCALSLNDPKRALEHFDAALRHDDPYDTNTEARGAGIYFARKAEAHLALGDLEAALDTANRAVDRLGGADSARGTSTLADLRAQFAAHKRVGAVADFLELTA